MTGKGLRAVRARLDPADGVTISEMLVVLSILMIVLGGLTTLFVSASTSQVDQTNRIEGQRNARLALDALRREIRCASAASISSTSLTITLPGYCQKPPTTSAAPFTWCATGASAPYALWRYDNSACSGTGRKRADLLASNAVFTYSRTAILAAPTLVGAATGGTLGPETYVYDVTAVDAAGKETSGTNRSITFATGNENKVTVSWSAYAGAVSYNVYGRDDGSTTVEGLRLLANTPSTSYVDTGPAGAFASMASPPLGTVGVSLVVDATPASGSQRFRLSDDIVLRNSGRG